MLTTTPQCSTCQVKCLTLLKNCSPDVLKEVSETKNCLHFKKGAVLVKEGEEPKDIYCIRSGIAKTEIHNNGQSIIMRLEGKGAIIGNRMARKKEKQPLSITAVENMQVCHWQADKFRAITAKWSELHSEMVRSLNAEIQSAELRLLSQVHHTVRQRVIEVLLHIAEIYHYQQGGCSIHVGIDRQDMADLAGTTKEQVSLVLSTLRQEKLVNFKAKHFKYFDIDGLKKIAAAS